MTDHCENCGTDEPMAVDGYTECCNEPICHGGTEYNWAIGTMNSDPRKMGVQTGTARDCCSARLQRKLPAGVDVLWRVI